MSNDKPPVWDLVIQDMKDRDKVGREHYGTPLQPFNGRDALVDAYQEALDLAVYLRQALEERGTVPRLSPFRAALAEENKTLRAQVDDLQGCNTALLEELRLTDRERMVREFHSAFDCERRDSPEIPSDAMVRLRLRLIAEEFFELLDAVLAPAEEPWRLQRAQENIDYAIAHFHVKVDFPAFVDATVDLDYVVEGTRATFGVKSSEVWREVHAANMRKQGVKRKDLKILKPEGWIGPDIAGCLKRQGWTG